VTQTRLAGRLVDADRGVVDGLDEAVGHGVAVDAAQGRDEMLGSAGSATVVAAHDGSVADLFGELFDL
jgi:hypothetical protein